MPRSGGAADQGIWPIFELRQGSVDAQAGLPRRRRLEPETS
jgi:hypothetical protein